MATIEDVAKLAGLSRTTVSRVINNHPYVAEEKRTIVLNAMKELNYVPNSSARRLRNSKTETIAVLIPRITNPFFSKLIESMEIVAADHGFQMIVCQTRYSPDRELKYLDLIKTRQVDGVILASIQNDWELIKPYLNYGPIILSNEYDDQAEVPMIRLNQIHGGFIGTRHLIEQGHDRIAYCAGGTVSSVARGREKGFLKALEKFNKPIIKEAVFRDMYNIEDGKKAFHRIRNMSNRPTAVFTGSDEVAAGIIVEAKKFGWQLPNDLAVIGFDNQAITEIVEPQITTINQPVKAMAEKSIEILLDKINTNTALYQEIYEFPLELIVRGSTRSK